jgi:hypothetical protein
VAHFVEQHKECIADDELHPIDAQLLGEVLLSGGRLAAEQQRAHHRANE